MKQLRVWVGPMSAAKTTGALQIARRYARQGMHVLLIRPANSKRDHEKTSGSLTTKNGEDFPSVDVPTASGIHDVASRADVVWIDEPTLWADEEALLKEIPIIRRRSIVLVSGLGATSELEPFGKSMPILMATADHIHSLTADCDACGSHGTATRSLYVGEAPKTEQVRVGGSESYRPACPDCWSRLMALEPNERRARLAVR